jgi:hypothetical protein
VKPTNAVELIVDALAVHRLTRLAQDDEVWPVPELREASLRRVGDGRWADLASCPWCVSVWIAGGVVAARLLFPRDDGSRAAKMLETNEQTRPASSV